MQFKKIILFFIPALPLSIALRLLQLTYTIDTETGFFKPDFEALGKYILIAIFAFTAAIVVFSFASHRTPERPPEVNIFTSLTSALLCFSVLYELAAESFPEAVPFWQVALLQVFGFATAAFFAVFALKKFVNFPLPGICTVIPTVYLILRIICDFTSISSLALISDNLLLMAAYCAALLFMLNFAKLYNNAGGDYAARRLMASGFSSALLCFTQSVPHIAVNTLLDMRYSHTTMQANVTVLLLGLFITAFTFSLFSKRNCCQAVK